MAGLCALMNMPQFDSEGIPNQAPETNKPMILNGPTSRNREGSDQVSVEAKQLGHLYPIAQESEWSSILQHIIMKWSLIEIPVGRGRFEDCSLSYRSNYFCSLMSRKFSKQSAATHREVMRFCPAPSSSPHPQESETSSHHTDSQIEAEQIIAEVQVVRSGLRSGQWRGAGKMGDPRPIQRFENV
ncbi:hypothetical protein ANN_13385 [Periplaneta americana]|uniref:Uncharacterized protein n=1 Tax=Periplaneta americana TaxID=6978 RepID=A0ABQ8TLH1_PERAM|nr:hypothetical protein ANN_13385 [Periplaneta americana]